MLLELAALAWVDIQVGHHSGNLLINNFIDNNVEADEQVIYLLCIYLFNIYFVPLIHVSHVCCRKLLYT